MKLTNLPLIPDKIPRSRMLEFLGSLGLPYEELVSFRLGATGIDATYYALDDTGRRYFDPGLNVVATHTVHIAFEENL